MLVEADAPEWAGPIACEATNTEGSWRFVAPGALVVVVSNSPLRITCDVTHGESLEPSVTPSNAAAAAVAGGRKGGGVGTAIGAGVGVTLGVVAAPVMGPAFAVLLAAGSVAKGYQLGGLVGAASAHGPSGYPSPIVLRIRSGQVVPTSSVEPAVNRRYRAPLPPGTGWAAADRARPAGS